VGQKQKREVLANQPLTNFQWKLAQAIITEFLMQANMKNKPDDMTLEQF
jgi:hypothetical protein